MTHLTLLDKEHAIYKSGEEIKFRLTIKANENVEQLRFRFELRYKDETSVGAALCPPLGDMKAGEEKSFDMRFQTADLTRGQYNCLFVIYGENEYGKYKDYDAVWPTFFFELEDENAINWDVKSWGHIQFPNIIVDDATTI